jgi:hypothetical protein
LFNAFCMLQEAQQKCANLASENAKLRTSSTAIVSTSRSGANGSTARRQKDATRQPIETLQHDYKLRTDVMDDDLSFIQEVVTGTATAIPDFNAEVVGPSCCRNLLILCCSTAAHSAIGLLS